MLLDELSYSPLLDGLSYTSQHDDVSGEEEDGGVVMNAGRSNSRLDLTTCYQGVPPHSPMLCMPGMLAYHPSREGWLAHHSRVGMNPDRQASLAAEHGQGTACAAGRSSESVWEEIQQFGLARNPSYLSRVGVWCLQQHDHAAILDPAGWHTAAEAA